MMTLMLLAGGFLQGTNLENPALPFSETIETVLPYLRGRSLAGILLTVSHFIFAYHFGLMLLGLAAHRLSRHFLTRLKPRHLEAIDERTCSSFPGNLWHVRVFVDRSHGHPTWQIGHLNPESDEEGTDIYPRPQSGMFQRGAHVYAANGCVYCHSQQVRADYIADDIERKWGDRRSAPRDYIFERPVFLGKMRMGQDLANIGARAPAAEESPSPPEARVHQARPRLKERLLHRRHHPRPAIPRQQRLRHRQAPRLPLWLRPMHRRRRDNRPAWLRHHPDKWRTLLGRNQSCRAKCANSRRTMADPDSWSAANVFCRLASCASLCAA
jgi:hypothetical protein